MIDIAISNNTAITATQQNADSLTQKKLKTFQTTWRTQLFAPKPTD